MATATVAIVGFCTSRVTIRGESRNTHVLKSPRLNNPWRAINANQFKIGSRMMSVKTKAAPDSISDKVSESIKNAEEVCAGDPVSGECAAAWDEVEEVSAAASDARLKKKEKESDPLENYCKDNPETDECRTYDN
ncbi:hypothetical protein Scep_008876 [Stephania cephalantha]|uniref:CP12 domain-containing protein n=1 Tax=Stephania cephalantha TaxID=152367 RepID=A0AAP0PFS4_9MAGN